MTIDNTSKVQNVRKLPQYLATLSVCLGALGAGTVLGWTGNISEDMKTLSFNGVAIDDHSLGWIGSISTLGMCFSCIPSAILCNCSGRKISLLLFAIPFLGGWLFIIFAQSLWMIYLGRFLTGVGAGAFSVAGPIYISEISQKEIRGTLSSFIDVHLSGGIFLANVVAIIVTMKLYTIVMGVIPLLFAITFAFQPESPVYYASRGYDDQAKRSIGKIRGKSYNIEQELYSIKEDLNCNKFDREAIINCLRRKGTQKAIIICFALKFFQQAVGINAVNFFAASIFKSTGVGLDDKISTLILGLFQLVATFVASIAVDRLGRKILLIISSIGSGFSIGCLALFFTLKDRDILDQETIASIPYLPLISLSLYIIMFSFGLGPIPIVSTAELFPSEIKSIGLGLASMFNSLITFIMVKFYFSFEAAMGTDGTFYLFTGMCLLSAVFAYFCVPETKGKSFAKIQKDLNV